MVCSDLRCRRSSCLPVTVCSVTSGLSSTCRFAPTAADVPGWPGPNLLVTLAAILGQGDLDYPTELPDESGWRSVEPASELAIALRNVELIADP